MNHHPPQVLEDGTVLHDAYRVEYLAAGGMSVAYRAYKGSARFFIKEVPASEGRNVMALTQEKATLERLAHPSIVRAVEMFEQDDHYYLVLDFVEGSDLESAMLATPDAFLPERTILDWAIQLCEVLEYLHGQDPPVIYRDLKPRNVILDQGGRLHLVDFGIARVFKETRARDTHPMGSALFASPEHYGGSQTDARSDIYTLGATLHYLASRGTDAGREAFSFTPLREVNPLLSERLEAVIARAVAIEPARRFASVGDMREALVECIQSPALPYDGRLPGERPQPRVGEAETRATTRGPLAWILLGLALGLSPLFMMWVSGRLSDTTPSFPRPSPPTVLAVASPPPAPTTAPGAPQPTEVGPGAIPPPPPPVMVLPSPVVLTPLPAATTVARPPVKPRPSPRPSVAPRVTVPAPVVMPSATATPVAWPSPAPHETIHSPAPPGPEEPGIHPPDPPLDPPLRPRRPGDGPPGFPDGRPFPPPGRPHPARPEE